MNKLFVGILLCGINGVQAMQPEQIKSELLGQKSAVTALIVAAYAEIDLVRAQWCSDGSDKAIHTCTLLEGVALDRISRLNLLCEELEHSRPAQCSHEPLGLRAAVEDFSQWCDCVRKQFDRTKTLGIDTVKIPPFHFGDFELVSAYTIHVKELCGASIEPGTLENQYRLAMQRVRELGCVDGALNWDIVSGRIVKWISYK